MKYTKSKPVCVVLFTQLRFGEVIYLQTSKAYTSLNGAKRFITTYNKDKRNILANKQVILLQSKELS